METSYTVRQAADIIGVKSYVLRYWEEELGLCIQRNELGHRYYTGYDIQLYMNIKELKRRGLQLRAIKDLLPQMIQKGISIPEEKVRYLEIKDGIKEDSSVSEECKNEKIVEFQAILERLITQEIQAKNEEEERCRSLDLAIRRQQIARREAAAACDKKNKRGFKYT